MAEFSGPQWISRFPGSASLDDLLDPFKSMATNFIDALQNGGGTVEISATYRPAERAYLMHWCCQIAGYTDRNGVRHKVGAETVPPMAGVDIDFTCGGNSGLATVNAIKMRVGYNIAYPAALVSRHTQRLAVDMTIDVPANSTIMDADGKGVIINTRANGSDPRIIAIGKSYGVIKLLSDRPHWSSDGK